MKNVVRAVLALGLLVPLAACDRDDFDRSPGTEAEDRASVRDEARERAEERREELREERNEQMEANEQMEGSGPVEDVLEDRDPESAFDRE